MTAQAVLDELKALGVRVEPRPNGNLYVAPKDRLPPKLLEAIRQHKAELLAYLDANQGRVSADKVLAEGLHCGSPEPGTLPLNLSRIADAIAAHPRSPILNDLAIAKIAQATIRAGAAVACLSAPARAPAMAFCLEVENRIVNAITTTNYLSAYELLAQLDCLPNRIGESRTQ